LKDEIFLRIANVLLREASLNRAEIGKHKWRFDKFVEFVRQQKPFKIGLREPFEEKVVSLYIHDNKSGKVLSSSSNLNAANELKAFNDWIMRGSASGYDVKPVWDNSVQSWTRLYKDPENFQTETFSGGIIQEKSLTPVGLGITQDVISGKNLRHVVVAISNKFSSNADLVNLLTGLLNSAQNSSEFSASIDEDLSSVFSKYAESDRRKIVKDFGEILSAVMLLNGFKGQGFTNIVFPNASNYPLVDFFLVDSKTGNKIAFSAKGLSGSGAALKNYQKSLEKLSSKNTEAGRLAKLLNSMTSDSLHGSVMKLANSNFFEEGGLVKSTLEKLETVTGVESADDETIYESVLKKSSWIETLKTYYGMGIPVRFKEDIFEKVSELRPSKDLVKSLFIYPILRACLIEMNEENSLFKTVAAEAINDINFYQSMFNFDSMKKPTSMNVSYKTSGNVKGKDVKFVTKAGLTTFSGGGIGIFIE